MKSTSSWWKYLLLVWIAVWSAVGIILPIAGNLADLAYLKQVNAPGEIRIKVDIDHSQPAEFDREEGMFVFQGTDAGGRKATFYIPSKPEGFDRATSLLVEARYDEERHGVRVCQVVDVDPGLTLPYIPGLEERARIIFFHVPMAWMTVIAFLVSMWYGIAYLRKHDLEDDMKSANAAGLGLLFCLLATITGSIWAKFNWGSFWNWDPRETSIFVLLLIYGAFFALRSAIEVEEKRARLSAVYTILAFVTVPFFIFIMPRILPGLHPGSADDTSSGPVMSAGGLNAVMRVILYSLLAGFIALFAWLMNIRNRVSRLLVRTDFEA